MTTAIFIISFLISAITVAWDIDDNVFNYKQILIVADAGINHDISTINKYLNRKNAEMNILYPKGDLCILLEGILLQHVSSANSDDYIMFVDDTQQIYPILNKQCLFFDEISMSDYIVHRTETNIIKLLYKYKPRGASRRLLATNFTGWISPLEILPRQSSQSAVAYYNNSIFLFGGDPKKQQLVQIDYNTQQQTFSITDHGGNILNFNFYGTSQYYTQMNEMLYWTDSDNSIIRRYNLATRNIDNTFQVIIPAIAPTGLHGCLESNANFLFLVGGGTATLTLNNLQIYNISDNKWSQGPVMQEKRRLHSCVINENTNELYAIAGQRDSQNDYLNSIERISINDIMNENWNYIDSLTDPTFSSKAISYKDSILIIGGRYFNSNGFGDLKEIHVIDCITGSISSGGYLNYYVYDTAAIYISDIDMIFAFGGFGELLYLNTWQYIQLQEMNVLSNAPTAAPITIEPAPTSAPSIEVYEIYIDIEFKYDLDMNTSKIITTIVDSFINETVNYECILSIVNNVTNDKQSVSTTIGMKIFVCDEETQVHLIAVFTNNLESDLITKINNNNEIQLQVSVNMINIILNGEQIDGTFYNTTMITSTATNHFSDTLNDKDRKFIYMIVGMGSSLVLIFLVIFCLFWRYKYRRKMKEISNILSKSQITTSKGVMDNTGTPIENGELNDTTDLELNEGEIEEMYTSEVNMTETSTTKGTPTLNGLPTVKGDEIITDLGNV